MRRATTLLTGLLGLSLAHGAAAQTVAPLEESPRFAQALRDVAWEDDGPGWSFLAQAEATYLKMLPDATSSFVNGRRFDVSLPFEAAPRVAAGLVRDDGWGVQSRFWTFDAQGSESRMITPLQYGIAVVDTDLYSVDLEMLRAVHWERWSAQATLGGRHASFGRHAMTAPALELGGGAVVGGTIDHWSDFNGGGLTASLLLARDLGESNWQVFGSGRGFALWGTEHRRVESHIVNSTLFNNYSSESFDADLAGAEVQVGLQWSHALSQWHGTVFFRSAFEYQHWNTHAEDAAGKDSDLDADFYGVAFSVGFAH
jgi:hypothetical protein